MNVDNVVAFITSPSDHGDLIVNRLDYNRSFNDEYYGVGAQILETGHYDLPEIMMLKALLVEARVHRGEGLVVLDCGANIGVHTVEFARLMRSWGSVMAIEAQRRLYYALCGNIVNFMNAEAHCYAVSDEDGEMMIPEPDYTIPSSFGSFELRGHLGVENIGQPINYDKPTLPVARVRIDSLGLERIDFIKMDIEGMEVEALNGAVETIERDKPILYVVFVKCGRAPIEDFVKPRGYQVFGHGMNLLCVHESDKTIGCVRLTAEQVVP